MMRFDKRGDLTAKQLITIIILVVSFSIILIFFFMLNLRGEINTQSCRNSVVMKSTPIFGRLTQFKCETEDICISSGGGCEGLTGEFTTIEIEDISDAAETISKLVGLQRDCFWMMGEGKIDIGDNVCAICNVIHFDEEIKKRGAGISGQSYYQYMQDTPGPEGSKNYIEYFYAPFTDWREFRKYMVDKRAATSINPPDINTAETYSTYFVWREKWFEGGLPFIGSEGPLIGIMPYNSQNIANLKCESFAMKS